MLYLQSSGTPADRSEAWTEAHIISASPKFSDGTGLEPAVTEKSRPVGSPGGLFLFSQAAPTHTRSHGEVDD
jgi:hypothetical protein